MEGGRGREGDGEGGRREQASALHALKGQMVTAGNWGANHSAGHRARDQQREGDRGREESEHMQRSRGEERSIWEEAARRLWQRERQREEKTEYFFSTLTRRQKETKERNKDRERRWGDSETRGKSIPPLHLERYRDKEGGKTKGGCRDCEVKRGRQRTGDS